MPFPGRHDYLHGGCRHVEPQYLWKVEGIKLRNFAC